MRHNVYVIKKGKKFLANLHNGLFSSKPYEAMLFNYECANRNVQKFWGERIVPITMCEVE